MPRAADVLITQTIRSSELDDATRAAIIDLCIDARPGEATDFERMFSYYMPTDALHVLGSLDEKLVGHAVVTTRWLQPTGLPLLRTAYIDAVSVAYALQGRGYGTEVMAKLATAITDYDIACLETEKPGFYARFGWEEWRGPLAGRSESGLVPTPDQHGVMVLRLPRTPPLDLDALLTIEVTPDRIW